MYHLYTSEINVREGTPLQLKNVMRHPTPKRKALLVLNKTSTLDHLFWLTTLLSRIKTLLINILFFMPTAHFTLKNKISTSHLSDIPYS